MSSNMLFEYIKKMLGGNATSPIGLLGGYAKLVTMDASIRDSLFTSEEEKEEIREITTLLTDYDIDVDLLKQGASLLSLCSSKKDMEEAEKILDEADKQKDPVSALVILKRLLALGIPEIELVKKGQNLSNILDYSSERNQKTSDISEGKKPAKETLKTEDTKEKTEKEETEKEETEKEGTEKEEAKKEEASRDQNTEEENEVLKRTAELGMLVKKVQKLTESLKLQVKGQNEAIRLFAEGYFQSEVFPDEERKGPSATFLFAGPPGVGKTLLSETAADHLGLSYLRLDMSEFSSSDTVKRLVGTEKHYVGSKTGELTDFVKNNPRSIILLDEIEKAHEDVIYQFLQVMDGGMLTDAMTKEQIDFKKTILIFTTNVGKSLYESHDRINLSGIPRAVVIKALEEEKDEYKKNRFPAAICSRFAAGNVIMFNHLETHILQGIADGRFAKAAGYMRSNYDVETVFDPRVSAMFLYSQSVNLDGRNISAQSTILVKNELLNLGRNLGDVSRTMKKLKTLKFRLDLPKDDPEILRLFTNDETAEILFFGAEEDIKDVPFSSRCIVHQASDLPHAMELIDTRDISFIVLDLNYGLKEDTHRFLSMDDWESEGIDAFNEFTVNESPIPLYILQRGDIRLEDQNTFSSRGVRGFLNFTDKTEFADAIANLCEQNYLQKRVSELSGRGRVLSFNTAQEISDDGESAEIIFYDFRTQMAASGEENQMMLSDSNRPKERFSDVIGAESAKEELKDFIKYMKNPKKYAADGSRAPKGILLYGPPGTGKTMLARAMAGECDLPFFASAATNFMDRYFGESQRKIRQLFATARKFAPSIVFIDEIDAIGKIRTGSEHTHITEDMLNTLLNEMDGFNKNSSRPVFVIAATNYDPDGSSGSGRVLDGALVRRFDNKICVNLPKEEERLQYLQLEVARIKNHQITDNALQNIASRTVGDSLSVLKDVLDLAMRKASREEVTLDDSLLLTALDEYMYGDKHEHKEEYYKSVSYHEAGHAYIYALGGWKPNFVTIVSRGNFGGYMQKENSEDTPSYTKEDLLWQIRTSLAGRASEIVFFGETAGINTGVSSDIRNASNIAMDMICRYAMANDHLLSLSPEQILKTPRGEKVLDLAEQILQDEMAATIKLVEEGKDKIEALALFLQKNNQATEKEIQDVFGVLENARKIK